MVTNSCTRATFNGASPTQFRVQKYAFLIAVSLFLISAASSVNACMPEYTIQQYSSGFYYTGIHLNDMDGDGWQEVLIGKRDTSSVEIWKYNPSTEVLDLVETISFGCHIHDIKAADLDGDGDNDLVVGLRGCGLYIATNNEGMWSTACIDSTYSWQVLLADFDLDGNIDIFDGTDWGYIKIFYGNGSGGFTQGLAPVSESNYGHARGFNALDLNGDGRVDLIGPASEWMTAGGNKEYMRAYLNTGTPGTIQWSSSVGLSQQVAVERMDALLSPSAGDLNGDGYIDQVAYTTEGDILLFEGGTSDGQLGWTQSIFDTLDTGPSTVGIADLNDDGNLDVHAAGNYLFNGVKVYLGDGSGNFTFGSLPLDHGVGDLNSFSVGDINGDGATDIVTVRYAESSQDGFEVLYQITPIALLTDLVETVLALNLQTGIENSLDAKLEAAVSVIEDISANNDVAAINTLQSFINAVEAQRGKKISETDADELIVAAQKIIDLLSCV